MQQLVRYLVVVYISLLLQVFVYKEEDMISCNYSLSYKVFQTTLHYLLCSFSKALQSAAQSHFNTQCFNVF